MEHPDYAHLEEIALEEVTTPSAAEWDIDPRMMGNVVGGVIAGRLQDEDLRLVGGPDEVGVEASVRLAILVAMERHTHLAPRDSLLCSEATIRYLHEPPFNDLRHEHPTPAAA